MHGWEATVPLLGCGNIFEESVLDLLFGVYVEVPTAASVSHSLPEQSESAALILQTGQHFRTKPPVKQTMGGCAMFPILSRGPPANDALSQDKRLIPSAFLLMLTQKLSFSSCLDKGTKHLWLVQGYPVIWDTGPTVFELGSDRNDELCRKNGSQTQRQGNVKYLKQLP